MKRSSAKAAAAIGLLLIGLAAACGGGGGSRSDGGTMGNLEPLFTASAPPANSLSLQPGGTSGENFNVRVAATGVLDLFSATFRVTWDPDSATFLSLDSSGSLLDAGGATTNFDADLVTNGVLDVTAERVGGGGPVFSAASAPTNSVSLQPGPASGNDFAVLVSVRSVLDFFGAAFRVTFDPASAAFVSADSSASFLLGGGASTEFEAELISPGVLAVVATRLQNGPGTVPGVDVGSGGQTLIRLNFQVTGTTPGNTFALATPREVCTSTGGPSGCASVSVTWQGGTLVNQVVSGVNVVGTQDLVVLRFRATDTTENNAFDFANPREVCNSSGLPACTPISVTYQGGTLVVTED